MEPEARDLIAAFVAAYRPYVERTLNDRGLPIPARSLAAGEHWLRDNLEEMLERPFAGQVRGPLEIFQEALRLPGDALAAAGVAKVSRDPAAATALPGDVYDLAPASSQALGEPAWRAHLAWGAAKARAHLMGAPSIIHLTRSLMDSSRVEAAAAKSGYRFAAIGEVPGALERHTVGFIDLEHPDADNAIRMLVGVCGRVVAYGPHVDDLVMVRATSLGAAEAVPRSRFFRDPGEWLPAPV